MGQYTGGQKQIHNQNNQNDSRHKSENEKKQEESLRFKKEGKHLTRPDKEDQGIRHLDTNNQANHGPNPVEVHTCKQTDDRTGAETVQKTKAHVKCKQKDMSVKENDMYVISHSHAIS